MFVRIGLVVVAIALLALLSLGIGLGTGFVRLTPEGIALKREAEWTGPVRLADSSSVSADDLLKQKRSWPAADLTAAGGSQPPRVPFSRRATLASSGLRPDAFPLHRHHSRYGG